MPEYTAVAVVAALLVVAVELGLLRTGLFRQPSYWVAMVIVFGFQVAVDGWLTKLSAPIVIYDGDQITGLRVPWDIPVEDYLFGFSMITLTLLVWLRLGDREGGETGPASGPAASTDDRTTEEAV